MSMSDEVISASDEGRYYARTGGVFRCPECKAAHHHWVKSKDVFICAECGHEFAAMTPEERCQRRRESNRAYYAAHREEILRKKHEYRMAHLEEEREKERLYRKRNAKRINELNRAWRAAHLEQERERNRRYWAEHGKEISVRRAIEKLYSTYCER